MTAALSIAVAVLLAFPFATPAFADLVAGTAQSTSVLYLPDVTEDMCEGTYWSAKQPNPTSVLANRATIDELNQAGIDAVGTMLQPLKQASGTYYTAERQQAIYDAAKSDLESNFLGKAYNDDWSLIDQEDVNEILANYMTDGTVPGIQSPFAIVTTHTTMRAFPTSRALMYTYDDLDDDNLYMSALRVNEPVIIRAVSTDGNYYLCISSCLNPAWVPAEDVAICENRDEWLEAWDIEAGQELVVTGYKVRTEQSNQTPNTANRMLYMGTVLERVDWEDASVLVGTRSTYNNHVCYLPVRNADGTYTKEYALIAESNEVSEGFLPLTAENIERVAFRSLGQMYGWGGMLEANDCSGYVRDVYKCFGLELARNTTWQMNMPVRKYDLSALDDAHKAAAIEQMPLGTVLFWAGHEMLYLGAEDEKQYVISATGSIGNLFGESGTNAIKGVVVNTLDMIRGDRSTWLQNITTANIPYISNTVEGPGVYDIEFYEGSAVLPEGSYTYTGSAVTPAASIPGLTEGTDYTVTYKDNVEPGTPSVTITGAGNYTGSITRTFEIVESSEVSYFAAQGDGASWTQGSTSSLSFTFKRSVDDDQTFSHFTGVQIDGATVDSSNYSATEGSVVIALKADYLNTLATGSHALTAVFDDGASTASFNVVAADAASATAAKTPTAAKASPKAGDDLIRFVPVLLFLVLAATGGVAAGLIMRKRNR